MADARAAATSATGVAGAASVGAGAPPPPVHPELQSDPLARLFLSIAGIVVAHKRGHFALDCWQLRDVCRETRYVEGLTQPGTVADLIFHGCRLGGIGALMRERDEARMCKREDYRGSKGTTQLLRAARDKDVERVRQLLRLGYPTALVNAQCDSGLAALRYASCYGEEVIVRELLAHGADVNIKSKNGLTPLMWASNWGKLNVVRLLCDMPGIDLAARDYLNLTALGLAPPQNRCGISAFLRSRGAPE